MASSAKIQLDNSPSKLLVNVPQNNVGIDPTSVYRTRLKGHSVDNTFDLNKFNQEFEDVQKRRQTIAAEKERQELSLLNKVEYKKRLDQLTVGEMAFSFKDSIFDTLTDALNLKFQNNNNRLFYLGLLIIISVFVMYVFSPNECDHIYREPKFVVY